MERSHFASLPSLRLTALRKNVACFQISLLTHGSGISVELDVLAEPVAVDSQHQTKIAGSREVRDNLVEAYSGGPLGRSRPSCCNWVGSQPCRRRSARSAAPSAYAPGLSAPVPSRP